MPGLLRFRRTGYATSMQSLIIHMSASTARRANVEALLASLPDAQAVEAVDGRDPAQLAGVTVRPGDLYRPAYPFPLLPGEIGCFLSHRRCWKRILDAGWDAALIAEDDLEIAPDARAPLLELLARHASPDAYIRIPPKDREPQTAVTDREGTACLFTPRRIGLQTTFQLVGRDAARRLLAATETIDRPVDALLQMHWITGQTVQTVLPNGCSERRFDAAGSTVQRKTTGLAQKLRRAIARARYRAAIAQRPQH